MPARADSRTQAAALVTAIVGGAAMSLLFFLNGRFGEALDSPALAGTISNTVCTAVLVTVAATAAGGRRAVARLREGHRIRAWHWAVGLGAALPVAVAAAAAPRLGIVLLTIALVAGQAVGSLVIDRAGLSPGGVERLTGPRVAGAALAVAAVALGAAQGTGDLAVGLLVLAALGGVMLALTQAVLGHVAGVLDDDTASGAWLSAVATTSLCALWLVTTGGTAPGGWGAPAVQWIVPGLLAAAVTVVMTKVVTVVGVLRLTLALVAGQSLGALVLDLVAPADGRTVTILTVVQLLLVLAAVRVSGLERLSRPRAAARTRSSSARAPSSPRGAGRS